MTPSSQSPDSEIIVAVNKPHPNIESELKIGRKFPDRIRVSVGSNMPMDIHCVYPDRVGIIYVKDNLLHRAELALARIAIACGRTTPAKHAGRTAPEDVVEYVRIALLQATDNNQKGE